MQLTGELLEPLLLRTRTMTMQDNPYPSSPRVLIRLPLDSAR